MKQVIWLDLHSRTMVATNSSRPSVDLQNCPVCRYRALAHLILRVAVRVCENQIDNFLVQPRPVLPRPRKPQHESKKNGKRKDRKSVVEITAVNRKKRGEAEEDHHPSGVDQSENVDRYAEFAQVPPAELDGFLDSCAEHAADRDEVGGKQSERRQCYEGSESGVAGDVEACEAHDDEDGEPDRAYGHPVPGADV